jgi:hypothetical protein
MHGFFLMMKTYFDAVIGSNPGRNWRFLNPDIDRANIAIVDFPYPGGFLGAGVLCRTALALYTRRGSTRPPRRRMQKPTTTSYEAKEVPLFGGAITIELPPKIIDVR